MKRVAAITLAVGATAGVLALASYCVTGWGGSCGYLQLEYELTFQDAGGGASVRRRGRGQPAGRVGAAARRRTDGRTQ